MASVTDRLNNVCNFTTKYINFGQLAIGEHHVRKFQLSTSKFGERLEAVLSGGTTITLPERFYLEFSTQTDVDALNATKKILNYKGKDLNNRNRIMMDIFEAEQSKSKKQADEDVEMGVDTVE